MGRIPNSMKRKSMCKSSARSDEFPNSATNLVDSTFSSITPRQAKLRSTLIHTAQHSETHSHEASSSSTILTEIAFDSDVNGSSPSSPFYDDLGDCNRVCEFCGAVFWFEERLRSFPLNVRARYSTCCRSGRVTFPPPRYPPQPLKALLDDKVFVANIRRYNSLFAMTSFGASVEDSINNGSAPYVFKVSGQISHWVGSLCPPSNQPPRFLQLYIYDTDNEVSNRLSAFSSQPCNSLSQEIVRNLLHMLNEYNGLVKLFRTARDICAASELPDFSVRLYNNVRQHSYDLPEPSTLGAIVHDTDPMAKDFDIVIHTKDNVPQRVTNLHPSYMSLQYPLLFPFGEPGWCPTLRLTTGTSTQDKRLTMNMYYSYMVHDRHKQFTLILRAGRLFQQYLVDAYICIERNRLDYILSNQNSLRSEFLCGIHDAVSRGDTEGHHIGKRILLPSSFTGGPRYMYKHYLDALAICRVHGNPQYFITFTCNVKWPEINRQLQQTSSFTPQDRPDIIARVFQMKVNSLLSFLKDHKPFGPVAADLYTIEFQKRGLPHCHMLLWVATSAKIKNAEDIDAFISAEIPDRITDPYVYKVVTELMMHGPCGQYKPNAPCMRDGVCSKKYPKRYEQRTYFDDNGKVHYKRNIVNPSVTKGGIQLDCGYVVPYNKTLCARFQAHINVEYCGWSMMIKYLFKYISKGADRVRYTISPDANHAHPTHSSQNTTIDEIKNFVDGRYICPHEAAWRIFDFHIHRRNPAVQVLAVHLEGMQNITFRDKNLLTNILSNPSTKKTTLTEWFESNKADPSGHHLRYIDYLSEYRWDANGKEWIRRAYKRTPTIGRLVYIHPNSGELFYLRMLLTHQTGCTSYASIRSVSNVTYPNFRATCEALGLIGDDKEWTSAFEEAATWGTPLEMRYLFTHMLLHCEVSNPSSLWNEQWRHMSHDIIRNICKDTNIHPNTIDDNDLKQHVLYEIEKLLREHSDSSSLSEYGLPLPRADLLLPLRNRLLLEERCYNKQTLQLEHERQHATLRPRQLEAYELIRHSIEANIQLLLFIYGHGGTGKTFLWTTIINAIRSSGKIVLAVTASGIASLLLPSGRTAHSRFKIPIALSNESLCYIKKHTQLSELLIQTSVVIWDEAPMSDRQCFESLDRSLRDILDCPNLPFGGKTVLLGGDFRQTLPVKNKSRKADIISASLPRSYLWPNFKIIKLTENMRLHRPHLTCNEKQVIADFSSWLLKVGDGELGDIMEHSLPDAKRIVIPTQFLIPHDEKALINLVDFIYGNGILHFPSAENLSDKAIVCPKNDTADYINGLVLEMAPGETTTYLSTDSITPRTGDRGDTDMLYPEEYLNQLCFKGIPAHQLKLKVNTPVILLRNLNLRCGLCNGTRLLVSQLLPKVIEARIITGNNIGMRVYIPRITFIHNDNELPFVFRRKQFPLRLCYAMTINKSQGQSLRKIGVYLPQDIFCHGQLYVALSRATSPESLKVLITPQDGYPSGTTKNIVYSDLLNELKMCVIFLTLSTKFSNKKHSKFPAINNTCYTYKQISSYIYIYT